MRSSNGRPSACNLPEAVADLRLLHYRYAVRLLRHQPGTQILSLATKRPTRSFIIVDQSLRDFNGHYYEYDISLARALAARGVNTAVLAHRNCNVMLSAPDVEIKRYFSKAWNETHHRTSERMAREILGKIPGEMRGLFISAASSMRRIMRRVLQQGPASLAPSLPDFGKQLVAYFDAEHLNGHDHVLLHTIAIAELHSVIAAVDGRENLPRIDVVLRRDADEPDVKHDAWGGISGAFAAIRTRRTLASNFRFFCDTDSLSQQYANLAGEVPVSTIPIPHGLDDNALRRRAKMATPACITYLGNARTEKGYHLLPQAIAALRRDFLETRRVRFVVQSNASLSLEEGVISAARRRLASYGPDKVELVRRDLTTSEFQSLLFGSNLILLPYQAERYRRRSSGILVQAMVAGIPVVVPAGTWLSEAAPRDAAVVFDDPARLGDAIALAIDRLPELQSAARLAAPHWLETHNAAALAARLLS